jgi:hypothetical protein
LNEINTTTEKNKEMREGHHEKKKTEEKKNTFPEGRTKDLMVEGLRC